MKYTSAQANKLLKKLNDEYSALLDKEQRSRDFALRWARTWSPYAPPTITRKHRRASQNSKENPRPQARDQLLQYDAFCRRL